MPAPAPQAFLSYTRNDDQYFGGYITAFRDVLEKAVHIVTGEATFRIFQDTEGIILGEPFERKIDDVLNQSSFLVPMLSPTFFNSAACRHELELFLKHEKELSRDDLILPIYFVSSAKAEKKEERLKDPLMTKLFERQMEDWREKRITPLDQPAARDSILVLARKIVLAIDRLQAVPPSDEVKRNEVSPTDPRLDAGGGTRPDEISPRTVLWVDDHPENNVWERRALESYGVHFQIARDTAEAERFLQTGQPVAAIISDLGRRGDRQAGFTLLDSVRRTGISTPYFLYTSRAAAHLSPLARAKGAQQMTGDPDALVGLVLNQLGTTNVG